MPVQLTFVNQPGKEQKFAHAESWFAVLDKDGREVKGALAVLDAEAQDIVLKGRSTTDTPVA